MAREPDSMGEGAMQWRAGDLTVNAGMQSVEREGTALDLPKLSFDLLRVLIDAAPNFVSNDELMTRVWGSVIVSPETVTQRVKLLRDALGDDPRNPQYIEGLRGRGYRLIPEVHRIERLQQPAGNASAHEPLPPPEVAMAPVAPGRSRWMIPMAVTALALAGVIAWMIHEPGLPSPSVHTEFASDRTAAILTFDVTGGDGTGVGLADSIAARLGEVRGMTVISRYSAQAIDPQALGAKESGRKLGARYLVQGNVLQQGSQLRVTATLTDSQTGQQVWIRQFTRPAEDLFGMQDEVAQGVKRALESRIADLDPGLPAIERSGNSEAWLAYLRGRTLLGRTTVIGTEAAIREFGQAVELDPQFVPAIAGLYDARMQSVSLRRGDLAKARAANAPLLERARQLQPDSGAADLAEAIWTRDAPERAVAAFESGLQRDPGNVRAMTAFSEVLDQLERRQEAQLWLERAMRVDPLWPRAHFRYAQRNFAVVGAAVEKQNLRTLELDPLYYPALQRHAKYQWMQYGKAAYAISVIEKAIASDPENPWGPHTAAVFYLDAGDPAASDRVAGLNAVAEASTRALRAQYRGDWKAAGEAAYDNSSFVFGGAERWGVATAIRDHARHTGQFERALDTLSLRYALPREGDWTLSTDNFREGQLFAHVLLLSGQREAALHRLQEVVDWVDANARFGPVYNLRTKAQALALMGRNDEALALLDRSFRESDYTLWWYTLQFDPTWDALRGDPRFAATAEAVRAWAATQHEQLQQMRVDGRVPDRASARADAARR